MAGEVMTEKAFLCLTALWTNTIKHGSIITGELKFGVMFGSKQSVKLGQRGVCETSHVLSLQQERVLFPVVDGFPPIPNNYLGVTLIKQKCHFHPR